MMEDAKGSFNYSIATPGQKRHSLTEPVSAPENWKGCGTMKEDRLWKQ